MARRKHVVPTEDGSVEPNYRAALAERMDTLAYRDPALESTMLQLARVGGLREVEKSILKRREYAKRASAVEG